MNLEKINHRLSLYPEWLKYWLNENYKYHIALDIVAPIYSPEYLMYLYRQQGYLMVNNSEIKTPLSFNQWLYKNGHDDLVDVLPILLSAVR